MNRKILIQVTAPAVLIGLLLSGVFLIGALHQGRLQASMERIRSENVASLEAAKELQIHIRQLRNLSSRYQIDQRPRLLDLIDENEKQFEKALTTVRKSAGPIMTSRWLVTRPTDPSTPHLTMEPASSRLRLEEEMR